MRKYIAALLLSGGVALLLLSTPVSAQAPYQTPTPLPAIQATMTAANAAQNAAQSDLQQAAQMEARAAELRRNGIAQQQQAQQAIGDARAASAAQNAAAVGEAIGQANGVLGELGKTNTAQADMIATLTANQRIQASAYISLSNENSRLRAEVQQAKADKQTTLNAYNAVVAQQETNQRQNTVILIFGGVVFLALMFAVFAIVARKWSNRTPAPPQPAPSDPPAAPIDSEWQDVTNETQP